MQAADNLIRIHKTDFGVEYGDRYRPPFRRTFAKGAGRLQNPIFFKFFLFQLWRDPLWRVFTRDIDIATIGIRNRSFDQVDRMNWDLIRDDNYFFQETNIEQRRREHVRGVMQLTEAIIDLSTHFHLIVFTLCRFIFSPIVLLSIHEFVHLMSNVQWNHFTILQFCWIFLFRCSRLLYL